MQLIKKSIVSLLPLPHGLEKLESHVVRFPDEAARSEVHCDVLICSLNILFSAEFSSLWERLRKLNPGVQMVAILERPAHSELLLAGHRKYPLFRVFESLEEPGVEWGIFEAIEKSNWIQQNHQLQVLVEDQFTKLKNLYAELEERVQKRQRYLEETRRKNLIAQFRWSTLRRATETIHESTTVTEMEDNLTLILKDSLNLVQVRILLHSQSSFAQSDSQVKPFSIHRVRLFQDQDSQIGYAVFFREESWPFSIEEKDFLQKISEAISLAIRRLNQLEITKTLREQWQATFNAVNDPIALISSSFEVIQTNSAFADRMKESAPSSKCYNLLFRRETPCPQCHLGRDFRISLSKSKMENWEVHSQPVKLGIEESPAFFNQYREITEQLQLEVRLIEGAKLAELGIIGSSIAHELNNPLGGILTFVQMLKMDLAKDHSLMPDLLEMEAGVLRCRDIVQNLLGFSRSTQADDLKEFDLREALHRALALIDLQTRAHGLDVHKKIPDQPLLVRGNLNLLSQAVANLLQDSIQSVRQNILKTPPHIEIVAIQSQDSVEVSVLDNGLGQDSTPRISLPLAQQIVLDHHGQFEVTQPSKSLRKVSLTIPRSKLPK